MPNGPYVVIKHDDYLTLKRNHPVVPERVDEIKQWQDTPENTVEMLGIADIANDAFFLGRTAADPQRFFHETLLQGDSNRVN